MTESGYNAKIGIEWDYKNGVVICRNWNDWSTLSTYTECLRIACPIIVGRTPSQRKHYPLIPAIDDEAQGHKSPRNKVLLHNAGYKYYTIVGGGTSMSYLL